MIYNFLSGELEMNKSHYMYQGEKMSKNKDLGLPLLWMPKTKTIRICWFFINRLFDYNTTGIFIILAIFQ